MYLDSDHNGYITPDELKEFLDNSEETSSEIMKAYKEADRNKDGRISRREFH